MAVICWCGGIAGVADTVKQFAAFVAAAGGVWEQADAAPDTATLAASYGGVQLHAGRVNGGGRGAAGRQLLHDGVAAAHGRGRGSALQQLLHDAHASELGQFLDVAVRVPRLERGRAKRSSLREPVCAQPRVWFGRAGFERAGLGRRSRRGLLQRRHTRRAGLRATPAGASSSSSTLCPSAIGRNSKLWRPDLPDLHGQHEQPPLRCAPSTATAAATSLQSVWNAGDA